MAQVNYNGELVFCQTWNSPAAAYGTDVVIFTAPFDCQLMDATYVHTVAGSDGSAVNLQLTKDTGTDAPGAGTDLLANTSNAGFNCKGTAAVVQYAEFKTTAGILNLLRGERVSLDFAGTTTALAGASVTLTIKANLE